MKTWRNSKRGLKKVKVSVVLECSPYYNYRRKFHYKPVRNKYKGKTFKEILREMLREKNK